MNKIILKMKKLALAAWKKLTKSGECEIFVLVEGGVVREIVNLPANIDVTVIDYDTEGIASHELDISPVDGELCCLTRW
jgi:hypothetical protein